MSVEEDRRFLRRAVAISRERMIGGFGGPFGAVVVRDGRILAEGWNEVTSAKDPTAHGEVVAIRRACAAVGDFALRGATIYSSCEPCPMCLAAIYWSRIGRLVYANTRADAAGIGFDDEYLYREVAQAPHARDMATLHLPLEEARAVFVEWAEKPDKIEY